MQIDLTQQEIALILEAMRAYETAPQTTGIMMSLLGSMFLPSEEKSEAGVKNHVKKERAVADMETAQRRLQTAGLVAKLSECSLRASEFIR